jgi:hypothetical protein
MKVLKLTKLCEGRGVKLTYTTGGRVPDNMRGMTPYKCTLKYQGRQLTTPFFMGSIGVPDVADVLSNLLSETNGVECGDFEGWCSDFGYDSDSRSAERVYKQCKAMAPKVRALLGHDYNVFAKAEH